MKTEPTIGQQDSPFYWKHVEVCEALEKYVEDKGGRSFCDASAWALLFKGKIEGNPEAAIKLKKSTMTSGALLISDPRRVFLQTKLDVKGLRIYDVDFVLRKKKVFEFLNGKSKPLENYPSYRLVSEKQPSRKLVALIEVLAEFFQSLKVDSIKYNSRSDVLEIDVRELITDRAIFDKILAL